jgi:hypothetical protein
MKENDEVVTLVVDNDHHANKINPNTHATKEKLLQLSIVGCQNVGEIYIN